MAEERSSAAASPAPSVCDAGCSSLRAVYADPTSLAVDILQRKRHAKRFARFHPMRISRGGLTGIRASAALFALTALPAQPTVTPRSPRTP
jgi:hypothetical protein